MSVDHDNGGEFSLVLDETSDVKAGGFTFDPPPDFFGQEQRTSPVNEKQSWAFSWTPADLSSSSHGYDPLLLFIHLHLFHTLQAHRRSGARNIKTTRREEIAPQWFFSRPYTPYFSAAKQLFAVRNRFGPPPLLPSTEPHAISTDNVAEVISYGDTNRLSTSWAGCGRFGGPLTTRTRKNRSSLFTRNTLWKNSFKVNIDSLDTPYIYYRVYRRNVSLSEKPCIYYRVNKPNIDEHL